MVGILGGTRQMLPNDLVEYGIHTENSDIRAHVAVNAGRVYVFWTKFGVEVCKTGKYKLKEAYQPGVSYPTARGYLVPWYDIPGIVPIGARSIIEQQRFDENESTSVKGEKASRVVEWLLRAGWFPLPALPIVSDDIQIQRSGIDLIVRGSWRIQVKCDYRGGEGGTGNLFLQIEERNPFGAK